MKCFKKMLQVAENGLSVHGDNRNSRYGTREFFFHMAGHNETFVFVPSGDQQRHIKQFSADQGLTEAKVDAPFKTFSIEIAGDTPITNLGAKEQAMVGCDIKIWCVMAVETSPNFFAFYSLVETVQEGRSAFEVSFTVSGHADGEIPNLVKLYINRLGIEDSGFEEVNETTKVRFKDNSKKVVKRKIKISHVIHIAPSANRKLVIPTSSTREVNWSHAFSVRGHWRTLYKKDPITNKFNKSLGMDLKRIGKDRDNNVCIAGRTWISEGVKNDHLPEIKKQRVVT